MVFGFILLLVALTISAVAAFYSIAGLVAIFSSAVIPIIIMGSALEIGKITATVWLHKYWKWAPWQFKVYLIPAIIVLMMITSMGIFGFLSKAHSDQTLVTGEYSSQVSLLDEQINIERENIENSRKLIKQLDDVVIKKTEQEGREYKDKDNNTVKEDVAERALQIRRTQSKDRARLTKDIELAQTKIIELQQKKAPIASQARKVEAEVGPIKYIAALIYGDNPDSNLLERAVRWVIILIVFVFDPLALVLILAADQTFAWYGKNRRPLVVNQESISTADSTPAVNSIDNLEGKRKQIARGPENQPSDQISVLENEETWSQRVIDEAQQENQNLKKKLTNWLTKLKINR